MIKFDKETLQELYLSYVNEFITVEKFAEHYTLDVDQAMSVIARGKVCLQGDPIWGARNRSHFYYMENMASIKSEVNRKFFIKRHENRLLSEHSA